MGSVAFNFWITGGDAKKAFNWRKILLHLCVHWNIAALRSDCMMALVLSISLGTNLESIVSRLISLWISLTFSGLRILLIVLHFSGFAFMPRWVSIKPNNFILHPWTHTCHGWASCNGREGLEIFSVGLWYVVGMSRIWPKYQAHRLQLFDWASPWKCSPLVIDRWHLHF